MTAAAKHAPTPWHTKPDWPEGIHSADDAFVCDCAYDGVRDDANAAFIVRAVNSHAALRDAIRRVRRIIDARGMLVNSPGVELVTQIEAALTLAEYGGGAL